MYSPSHKTYSTKIVQTGLWALLHAKMKTVIYINLVAIYNINSDFNQLVTNNIRNILQVTSWYKM